MALKKMEYAVEGMGCEGCVTTVTNALMSIEGVVSAEVDLACASAHVEVGEPEPGFDALAAAVEGAGYRLVRS